MRKISRGDEGAKEGFEAGYGQKVPKNMVIVAFNVWGYSFR